MFWQTIALFFYLTVGLALLVFANRWLTLRRGVRIDARWYLESALKWVVTGLNLVMIGAGSLSSDTNPARGAGILIGLFSIVAVWSSPYRRKARITATVGHTIIAVLMFLTALPALGKGRGAVFDLSITPFAAVLYSLPSILTVFVIWLTARRPAEDELVVTQGDLPRKGNSLGGLYASPEGQQVIQSSSSSDIAAQTPQDLTAAPNEIQTRNTVESHFCTSCGTELDLHFMYCPKCGHKA